jgi:hypothetical protein|tara:strand:- start:208 stop:417 length:210 start_codon:yes stop_codon:yes gene_type:complete
MANKELLEELMNLTIEELIKIIKQGEASPSTLNVARQLLRDNQVTAAIEDGSPMQSLVDALPFEEDGDS